MQIKCSVILNRMLGKLLSKDFIHKKEEITKQVVSTKLYAVGIKFRQAVDTGEKVIVEGYMFKSIQT